MIWAALLILISLILFLEVRYNKLFRYSQTIIKIQDEWLFNSIEKKRMEPFFEVNKFKKVAIVGVNRLAFLFWREMVDSEIEVLYCVDEKEHKMPPFPGLRFISFAYLDNEKEQADVFIDVNIEHNENFYFRHHLKDISGKPVISISNVVFYAGEV